MPAKPTHTCPLCRGTGKVSAKVARAKVTIRDRAKWNEAMRKINERRRRKVVAT